MRPAFLAVALLAGLVAVFAACGGDGGAAPVGADASASPSVTPMTDQEYLKAICTGVQSFSDALVSKSNADDIAKVIRDFSASMKALNPPPDLRQFNTDFGKYLDDAVKDPSALLTRQPPLPSDSARKRLTSEESNVAECKSPSFFDLGGPSPVPTRK